MSKQNQIPSFEVYVHRTPRNFNGDNKPVVAITDDKGKIKQIVPWDQISENAPAIGNSVANIVGAVKGNFGFPYAIIPELVNTSFKYGVKFKEETADQEVYKLNYGLGINDMKAEFKDGTKIEINLKKESNKQK